MKVTIVVDNIEHAGIPGEWGFCAYIEQNGKKLLLDTGASNLFAENAEKLNIDLKNIDFAVLSMHIMTMQTAWENSLKSMRRHRFICRKDAAKTAILRKALSENILGFRRGLQKDIRIESNMFPGFVRLQREFIWCHIPRRI